MEPFQISITGYDITEKQVKKSGNSGRVYLPPSWIGKRVKVVLLEPVDDLREEQDELN